MSGPTPLGGLLTACLVAVAAACGACLRLELERRRGPRGVLAANTAASALAGMAAAAAPGLVVLTAFVLALGTFSTVAADAATEVLEGRWGRAVRRWAVHLGWGAAAATLGWWAAAVVGEALSR